MHYINSTKKTNTSFLAVIVLMMTVVLATFGTATSFADTNIKRQKQTSKFIDKQQNQPVLEVLAAGNLDSTFGSGGKVTTQIGSSKSEALAIAVQTDGKVVAAGYSSNGLNTDFALTRYNNDGTLDTTFGSAGKVTTDINNADNESLAVAIQADGKIVAGGSSFNGTDEDFALVRYNTNGTLDNTFGTGGIVATNFSNSPETIDAIAIQPDGKIVAAGYVLSGSVFRFALARYNSNGTLDDTFGTGGKVTTGFTGFDDLARAIRFQTDGKLVVAGEANGDFAVARYNSNGTLDTTFDTDGKVTTSINLFDSAYDVAIQTDGKIVAAGETGDGNNTDFALIRYDLNGALDATFDGDGIVTTAIGASDEFASSVALQSSGKIIAGGFSFNGNTDDFAAVRYNSNGSLDTTFGSGGKVLTDFGTSSYDYISALAIQSNSRIIAVGSANFNFAAAAYSLDESGCTFILTPSSADILSGGGAGSFTITTAPNCSYTAISNAPWINFTSGVTGTGSGTINFLIGSNPSVARTGIISVGSQVFTINQAAGSGKSRKRVRFF